MRSASCKKCDWKGKGNCVSMEGKEGASRETEPMQTLLRWGQGTVGGDKWGAMEMRASAAGLRMKLV